MSKIDDLEKRLHNTECMLLSLYSVVADTQPPEMFKILAQKQQEWFEASQELGAFNVCTVLSKYKQ